MQDVLRRFLSFERPIGPALVRIVYFVGAACIVLGACLGLLNALTAFFGGNFGTGLVFLLACELFMLAFMAYDRLVEIRDRLPDYSKF